MVPEPEGGVHFGFSTAAPLVAALFGAGFALAFGLEIVPALAFAFT